MIHRILSSLAAPFLLAACVTTPQAAQAPQTSEISYPGVVSAADPRAAEAGAKMLRAGGSATDAAIATMLALTVVEPQSSGIGGGGFFLHGDNDGTVVTLDGRETAPLAATPEWFLDKGTPHPFRQAVVSGLSVGVPGNLRLAAKAHARFGKLEWAALFQPAIILARDGFRVSPRFHDFLTRHQNRAGHDPAGQSLFYDDAGAPLPVGTLIQNLALAATLTSIAADGADAFYKGANAAAIAQSVAAQTPHSIGMTPADLADYAAKERPPVCGNYRGWKICGMGPPSSGATTVFAILKQLEGFDLGTLGSASPISWHLIAESQRLAYADRELYLADADFVDVPVDGLVAPEYLAGRGEKISDVDTIANVAAGHPPGVTATPADGAEPEENGTSHFAVVDRFGHGVSYTSTIEGPFGSGIMIGGYFLNNELTDFSFVPEIDGQMVANRVEGGKRPRSSMSPTLAYTPDGRLTLVVGAAGGSTIPAQVARVLIGVIDWKLTIEQALALPVIFAPADIVYLESGSALEAMAPNLRELGHAKIVTRALPLKSNAVLFTPKGWQGAADPRSEGAAAQE